MNETQITHEALKLFAATPLITEHALTVLERASVITTEEGYQLRRGVSGWLACLKYTDSKGVEGYRPYAGLAGQMEQRDCTEAYWLCRSITGPPVWNIYWTTDTHLTSEMHSRGGPGQHHDKYENCSKAEAITAFQANYPDGFIMAAEVSFPVWDARLKQEAAQREEEQARTMYDRLKARFEPAKETTTDE